VEAQLGDVQSASITVVDNGSTDGSASAVSAHFPRVKLFALKENRGFTGGINTALGGSSAELVVFLNNDAIPEKGWLAALTAAMRDAPPDVVSVGGRIVDLTGKNIDFIGGVLTFDGHALQNGFRYPIGSRPEPEAGAEILFACGGNMISRRAPLMALGGFDDDYFAYLEDVDFGWRSWIAGYRVVFEPRALVRHASSATSVRLGNFERGVLFERNALQTAIKNFENLRESGAAVLYAYLSRMHHYIATRNPRAQELTRPAMTPAPRTTSLLARVRRRLAGRPLAPIDDPLTAMQIRALHWFFENESAIAGKRERVQAARRRSDEEIFRRFPLHLVPTYPGDDRLMSSAVFRMLMPDLPSAEHKLDDMIRT
jgi:GT2 family glycosyltransferase